MEDTSLSATTRCLAALILAGLSALAGCAQSVGSTADGAATPDVATMGADGSPASDASTTPAATHWTRAFSDPVDLTGLALAVSPGGQIAIAGAFQQAVDFGLGPLTAASAFQRETFVAVFDPRGNALWNRSLRLGYNPGEFRPLLAFTGEELVVAGTFDHTRRLDVGQGPVAGPAASSVFVARFDTTGHALWTRMFGNDNGLFALDLAANAAGDVILSGRFHGAVDLGVASYDGGTSVSDNTFLVRLDATGAPRVAASVLASGLTYSRIAVAPAGDVTMVGALLGTADFGGTTLTHGTRYGLFVAGFTAGLTPSYARLLDVGAAAYEQTLFDVAIGANGDITLSGSSIGPADFGAGPLFRAGPSGTFLLTLHPDGRRAWDAALGPDILAPLVARNLAGGSEVLIASAFRGAPDLGRGAIAAPDAGISVVLAGYDSRGAPAADRVLGFFPQSTELGGFAVISPTDVVVMGRFSGTVDLGTGPVHSGRSSEGLLLARIARPAP